MAYQNQPEHAMIHRVFSAAWCEPFTVDVTICQRSHIVRVRAPAVFATDASATCCGFLARVFGVSEIRSVQVDFANGMAAFHYAGEIPPADLLNKMAEELRRRAPPPLGERLGQLLPSQPTAAVTIYRHELGLSTWEVLASGPGALRVRHDAVRRSSRAQQVGDQLEGLRGIRSVHWHRFARELEVEFDASWDQNRLLALLDSTVREVQDWGWSRSPLGRMRFEIRTKDIESLIVVMAEQLLRDHDIRVPRAELRLAASAKRTLAADLRIRARRGIVWADLQINAQLVVDDQRMARLCGLQVTGHGILGRLLATLARPRIGRLVTQPWSLDQFMPEGFSLKDIQFKVDNAVAICVEFEPCWPAISEAAKTPGQSVRIPTTAEVGLPSTDLAGRREMSVIDRSRNEEGAQWAHRVPRRAGGGLGRGVYEICFAVSFLASFPPLLLANFVPRQNAVARGCADGRDAARQDLANLAGRVRRP